jgi:hypothetical protein
MAVTFLALEEAGVLIEIVGISVALGPDALAGEKTAG